MAASAGVPLDEDGDSSDWFEIFNPGGATVRLDGWWATDDPGFPRQWRFPAVDLAPGGFLVVFASGKNRAAAGSELHTNFSLGSSGEYLALVRPDGSVAHAYTPRFPPQRSGISYGLSMDGAELVSAGAAAQILVPASGALGTSWTLPGFVPGPAWTAGPTGIGYHEGGAGGGLPPPVGYWSFDGNLEDASGNDNLGSFDGGAAPVYVQGFDGAAAGAVDFDGADDFIDIAQNTGLPIYSHPDYTVALWVKGAPQGDKRVFSEGSSSSNNSLFTIGTDNTGGTGRVDIFIRTEAGTTVVNHVKSTGVAFDGAWHHIAWVDRSGNADLYIDGVLDATNFDYARPVLPLDITSVGAVLRAAACCFFDGSIDGVAVWDLALGAAEIASLAAGTAPLGGNPYAGLIATDVEGTMRSVNATAYLRLPFTIDDPSGIDRLHLKVKYEDGFAAYLNGAEVARRNAPAVLSWNSAATAERASNDARTFEDIDISAHAGDLFAGGNILAVHGLNRAAADDDFLLLPTLMAASTTGLTPRYFITPSPGAANGGGVVDFVADTLFSVDRGFHDAPFDVEITTTTAGAVIRYTIDGSAPTLANGVTYTGPIRIATTTTLRAAAFKEGFQPTNTDTHTYIFLDGVIRQPNNPPGYPTTWQGFPADYAMDPEICTNTASPHYAPTIKDDLKSLPSLSLVLNRDDWMGPTRGIYTHTLSRGSAWERPASVELIFPDGRESGFQIDCGVRMQGGSSARAGEGKHAFRLLFKSLYGPPKLRYRLFRNSPVEEFDTLVLRCFSTDSWHFKDGGSRYRRWDSQFIRDLWMKDTQLAMGQLSGHNTYVHLYVNGFYWGLYNPSERPDDDFQASHQGDRPEDWDVMKDFNELFRGNRASWDQLMSMAAAGLGSQAAYQRLQGNNPDGSPNPGYPVLLDVDNLIDYMILHLYGCSEDWPHHNWYGARSRTGNLGGWRFFVWDQEIVMDFVFRNRIDVNNENSPARVYASLRANPEFRVRFGDHVQKHLFDGGPLSIEEARRIWMARANEIDRAVVGESARWGDYRMDVPDPTNSPATLYTREDHWLVEQGKVINTYIPESHRLAVERFRAGGLFPLVEAPAFNRHGGRIEAGFELQMGAPAGTVYYTLDGSDPRLTGGAVSPAARVAGEATGGTTILRSGDPCRAMVPPDGAIGLAWTMPGFADAAWKPGTTGVGFERTTGYEALIGTDMGTEMDGINASVYVRIPFTVAAPAGITGLTLRMKYDDGFAAYLNGVLVASSNAPAGLTWNSEATTANPDANAIVFQEFDITAHIGDLRAGTNILALHGLNSTSTSSDMLVLPEVVAAGGGGGAGAGAGSVQLEGTTTVKARALDGDWSALTEAFFHVDLPLRITEVMYHPADEEPGSPFDADDFEFLELQNIGAGPLDLRGFRLTGGIEHDFTGSALVLLPGEVVLVVKSLAAFAERYPFLGALVSGEYSGNLGNAGERLRLVGPQEEPLLDFEYSALWEPETDGLGYSLVAADPGADPSAWGTAAGWRRSAAPGGSPGEVESGPPPVGGLQLPGDVNQDAVLDISDAVRGLFLLFVDAELPLPCSGDDPHAGGNLALLDVTGDGRADLSDPVAILNFLFQGGAAPALGTSCRRLTGCPDACR